MQDKDLIRGCLRGKPEMQTALYRRFAGKMLGICLRYSGTKAEAEDILQQGFIKVFFSLSQYKDGSLEGWIRKIMVNEAIDYFRKKRKDIIEIQNGIPEDFKDEGAGILDQLGAEALMELIRKLPEGCRLVFNLYAVEGYSHSEIGNMLQISEGNSRTQYHRARQILQDKILMENLNYGKG